MLVGNVDAMQRRTKKKDNVQIEFRPDGDMAFIHVRSIRDIYNGLIEAGRVATSPV